MSNLPDGVRESDPLATWNEVDTGPLIERALDNAGHCPACGNRDQNQMHAELNERNGVIDVYCHRGVRIGEDDYEFCSVIRQGELPFHTENI